MKEFSDKNCYSLSFLNNSSQPIFIDWYNFFISFFDKYNIQLSHGGISYPTAKGKLVKIKTVQTHLSKIDNNDITAMDLLLVRSKELLGIFPLITIIINTINNINLISCCIDESIIDSFEDPLFHDLSLSIINKFKPEYGYYFLWSQKFGPSYYAEGVIYEGTRESVSEQTQAEITNWLWKKNKIFEGYLRDICSQNFIKDISLNQRVNGIALRQWIELSSKNGQLNLINEDLLQWSVENSEIERVKMS